MLTVETIKAINTLRNTLVDFSSHYYFKLHKMYNPRPVTSNWSINKGRINDDIHLLFVLKGKGDYYISDRLIHMKKGQLFLVTNGISHSASCSTIDPVHIFSMRFGIYEAKTHQYIPNFFKQPFGLMMIQKNPEIAIHLLERMYSLFIEENDLSTFAANTLMCQLLLNICEESIELDTTNQLITIKDKILLQHGKNISINSMAQQMSLSTKQFTRLFSKEYHTTPHQFIIKARINHAKNLLDESSLTIGEIADEVGYSDAFTFSKQFKKVVGQSPNHFRQINQRL